MANRHFAKLADVWKHLPLVAVLSIERPRQYWESHAGNALYSMVDDAERRYGAPRFVDASRCSDGMTALHESLVGVDGEVVAHIDPYDPWAQGPAGVSAVGLARELIQRGVGLVYWYGFDGPEQRGWAFDELRESSSAASLWCGDVMVASHEKAAFVGHLGDATTPGTGFGVVCANVSTEAINACRRLGEELARAYDGIPLPDGMSGHLDFTVRFAPGSS
jgi:hypothetical protein